MWTAIRNEDPTAKLVPWTDPFQGKYNEEPDNLPSWLADFRLYSPFVSPASDQVNYINITICSEKDPTAFAMGRKSAASLIYDWLSKHDAETKKNNWQLQNHYPLQLLPLLGAHSEIPQFKDHR
jgi:hypothetical protein